MALDNDSLKRFFDQHPSLRNKTFSSVNEFNSWVTENNVAGLSETDYYNVFSPKETPSTNLSQDQAAEDKNAHKSPRHTDPSQHQGRSEFKPTHDIEEDRTYQQIIKNQIEDWNRQNPNDKFTGKTFTRNSTKKLILNPELTKVIKNIHGNTLDTMRTGFGDDAVDKYKDAEKYRVYKNHKQDPTYQILLQNKNDTAYDNYVNTYLDKSLGYARKDKEMRKALQRREKRLENERKANEKIEKEKRRIYKNPNDDPAFQKTKAAIEEESEKEYQRQLAEQKRTGKNNPTDRERIRQSIRQQKYEEFIKSNKEKAKRYARSNPELKAQLEAYEKREEAEKRKNKELSKSLKKLRKNTDPSKDFRIQQLEKDIAEKIKQIDPAVRELDKDRVLKIREKAHLDIVRKNPDLDKNYAGNSDEIRAAHEKVTRAQDMGKKRGILYKLKNNLNTYQASPLQQIPQTQQPVTHAQKQPTLTPAEWQKRLTSTRIQQEKGAEQEQDDQNAWRGRGFNRLKSYVQSNHAPEGLTPLSGQTQGRTRRPRRTRPRVPLNNAEKGAQNLAKSALQRGATALFGAAAPYIGIAALIALIIIILIIIVLIIYFIVKGDDGTMEDFKISISKTGPPSVDNEKVIEYNILVTMSGTADKVVVTDQLPANTVLEEAPPGAELKDATGATTTDITKAKSVIWTLNPNGGGNAGNDGNPPDLNATSFEELVKGQGRNTTILGDEDAFVDAVFGNILESRPVTNRTTYESYVRTIYKTSLAKNVNPLIPLVIWGVEQSFEINGREFGCKPFDTGFATQVDCSVNTLNKWMTDFETKKASGIFPVPYTIHNTCSFEDPFIYAYEAYTPVCSMNDSNDEARTNFVILFKEFLGGR